MGEGELVAGELVAGKLRVIRQLGVGGMGAVYEVEHELTKHRRALKMLHARFARSPALVARFLREASAAGRIDNPHIVQTFDAGQLDSGEPYLVMELLDGTPLDGVLRRQGKLEAAQVAGIIAQAAEAMHAAHEAGIVHRDLKPENLFLVKGDRLFVKVLDFGISKFDESLSGERALTAEGSVLGTPFYMSPEQVRGDKNVDRRTDIYALGVVMYECLCGARPFSADNLPELSVRIHEGQKTPLAEVDPSLPAPLVAVAERAMARDARERFESAEALAAAIHQAERDLSLGEAATVAMPSALPPPAASALPHPGTLPAAASRSPEVPANSMALADTQSPASAPAAKAPRRAWGLAVLAVLAVLVALVAASLTTLALFARRGVDDKPATYATAQPSSARTLPVQPSASPVATTSASAGDAGSKASPHKVRSVPTRPQAAPEHPSRSQQHHMATDNPF